MTKNIIHRVSLSAAFLLAMPLTAGAQQGAYGYQQPGAPGYTGYGYGAPEAPPQNNFNYSRGFGDFPPSDIDAQLSGRDKNRETEAPAAPAEPVTAPPSSAAIQPGGQTGSQAGGFAVGQPPVQAVQQRYPSQGGAYGGYPNRGYPPPRRSRSTSPWGGSGPSFGGSGPWNNNRGSGFRGPWGGRGSGFDMPWDSDRWGGRNRRNPWGDRDMTDWMRPDKDNMGDNWDDMLNAPSRMGKMPGGWYAPSVSVPNPVDVGDEFDRAARDIPKQSDSWNMNPGDYFNFNP